MPDTRELIARLRQAASDLTKTMGEWNSLIAAPTLKHQQQATIDVLQAAAEALEAATKEREELLVSFDNLECANELEASAASWHAMPEQSSPSGLRGLITQWRDSAVQRSDNTVAVNCGVQRCADELEALLPKTE
jgi:Flp pilus assembly protein CpaB